MPIQPINRRALVLGTAALWAGSGLKAQATEEKLGRSILEFTPQTQAATFRNVDRLSPVRAIRKGSTVRALEPHAKSLDRLVFDHGDHKGSVDKYMKHHRTGGLIVLKDGQVAMEKYGLGNTASSKWTSFSTAKSMTSTLAGAALHQGLIRSLDDPAETYVPELNASAYEGVSIRNVLRMCSGVKWIEEYVVSGDSDIARMSAILADQKAGGLLELMRTRPAGVTQGTKFNYSTGETFVLASIVRAAVGKPLTDYFSERVWQPAGMEADGYWQLDSATDANGGGMEGGGFGVSACLRDYARFGQFMLDEGKAGGQSYLPEGWRDLAGHPDCPATADGNLQPDYPLGYGYQWWSMPKDDPIHGGAFTAQGIFGQFIYIHPKHNIVAVVWSAWPTAWDDKVETETYRLIGAAIKALA